MEQKSAKNTALRYKKGKYITGHFWSQKEDKLWYKLNKKTRRIWCGQL